MAKPAVGFLSFLIVALLAPRALAQNVLPCQYAYLSNGTAQPAQYAPPWDVLGSGVPLPNIATVDCTTAATKLTVGAQALSTQYVWKTAYLSTDGVNWNPITLAPSGTSIGQWAQTSGTVNLNLSGAQLTGWNYIEFLLATKQAGGWAIGGCSSPQLQVVQGCTPKWSVQAFYQPPQLVASVGLSNTAFPAQTGNFSIGNINITMNLPSPAFVGSLAISGANACGINIVGNAVQTKSAGCNAGTYNDWNIVATPTNNAIPALVAPQSVVAWTTNGIAPLSASILSDASIGTVIATETCTDTSNVSCSPVTWSLTGAPSFITINPATGAITTTGTPVVGSYPFTVTSTP